MVERDRYGTAIGEQRLGAPEAWLQIRDAGYFVLYRGKLVTIEMKSRRGQCSPSQRAVREALLRAGAQWWVCRSANAAMWALAQSGVPFRTIVHEDGTIERWQQPELPAWERPKDDPHERRPRAPPFREPGAVGDCRAGASE